MKLILNWSKQQWLGMDAYQKSAVNFGRTSYSIICKSLALCCCFLNNPQFVLVHHQ